MKNNLEFYRHEAHAHEHPKFKMLRVRFSCTEDPKGWAADGRFWALNSMIAKSNGCWLDISKPFLRMSTAADLDMTVEFFDEFIEFLTNQEQCGLVIKKAGKITTQDLQERLEIVNADREKARKRKGGKSPEPVENLDELFESSPEQSESSPALDNKLNQTKLKETKPNKKEEEKKAEKPKTKFEIFWEKYPNKKSKDKAEEKFKILIKKTPSLFQNFLDAIEAQKEWRKKCAAKTPPIFTPPWKHPTTWLNQGCWKDGTEIDGDAEKQEARQKKSKEQEEADKKIQQADAEREKVEKWVAENNGLWREIMKDAKLNCEKSMPNIPLTDAIIRIEARRIVIAKHLKC